MGKTSSKKANATFAGDTTLNGQEPGHAYLSGSTDQNLEITRRYGLSRFMVLCPENDEGNEFLNELENMNLLPVTISWRDENGWTNRLFIRPPGLLPQSLRIGFGRVRFITGSWKADKLPKICEWLPYRTFLHREPAEIPLVTLDIMAMAMEVTTDMMGSYEPARSFQDAGDQEDVT